MGNTTPPAEWDSGHATYTLRLKGHLDDEWAASFEHLSLTREDDGTTTLYGLVDQAALHGLLRKVRDTGIVLLSVTRIEPTPNDNSNTGA